MIKCLDPKLQLAEDEKLDDLYSLCAFPKAWTATGKILSLYLGRGSSSCI